jgi:hypothetical protein
MDYENGKKVQAEYYGYCGIYMIVHPQEKKARVGSAKLSRLLRTSLREC